MVPLTNPAALSTFPCKHQAHTFVDLDVVIVVHVNSTERTGIVKQSLQGPVVENPHAFLSNRDGSRLRIDQEMQ